MSSSGLHFEILCQSELCGQFLHPMTFPVDNTAELRLPCYAILTRKSVLILFFKIGYSRCMFFNFFRNKTPVEVVLEQMTAKLSLKHENPGEAEVHCWPETFA